MFWTVRGANAILALRCYTLNGRFEECRVQRLADHTFMWLTRRGRTAPAREHEDRSQRGERQGEPLRKAQGSRKHLRRMRPHKFNSKSDRGRQNQIRACRL